MIKNSSESMASLTGGLRFSRKKATDDFAMAPLSAREQEIAKSREELLGLLRDLPESEYELSLSDLVENGSPAGDGGDQLSEEKKKTATRPKEEANKSSSMVKESKKKRNSWISFGSGHEGVLLNMYMPTSLTRSRTVPRSSQSSFPRNSTDGNKTAAVLPPRPSQIPGPKTSIESDKRDWQPPAAGGCWSTIWDRGWRKSRRL